MLDRARVAPYKRRSPTGLAAGGDAQVAQLVEHATENRSVGGSIPPLGTTLRLKATRGAAAQPGIGRSATTGHSRHAHMAQARGPGRGWSVDE